MRVAFFIEGTFVPERDGASTRFARLPAALCHSGLGVFVFHAFRGWSSLERIALQPYPTYFFHPNTYHNDLDLLVRLVLREEIDIVQMNDLETLHNVGLPLAHATGVKLVYEALYHSSTLAYQLGTPSPKQAVIRFLEREIAERVDHIIVLNEPDRQRWLIATAAPADRLSIVPFGVDCASSTRPSSKIGTPSVAFLGNCYFEPNRRAVEKIVKEIWPPLRRWKPEASCLVIGDMPNELARACLEAGIELTGEVPDPGALLRNCAIGLAPVTEGSGVRVKLLHYLASGLPAIATSTAAEGLEFPALFIEDRVGAYAEVIGRLLAQWQRVRHLVGESQDLLAREFSWNAIAESAVDLYRHVVSRPTRERPAPGPRIAGRPMWLDEAIESGRFAACDDLTSTGYRYGIARDGTVDMYQLEGPLGKLLRAE